MDIQYFHAGSLERFSAGGLRTVNVARALVLSGHSVTIITGDRDDDAALRGASLFDLPQGCSVRAGGVKLSGRFDDRLPRRLNPLGRLPISAPRPDLVLLFGANSLTFNRARRHAAALDVPLVVDVDEWMEPASFRAASWPSLFPLRYELFMRRLPALASNILAISESFARYLGAKGARTLVVPPVHQPEAFPLRRNRTVSQDSTTRVLVPGVRRRGFGKDELNLSLIEEALRSRPALRTKFRFDVVGGVEGASAREALRRLARSSDVKDHGRVSWDESKRILSEVDWMLALRDPSARRLKYAFPSKVTESLVAGTPVIVNDYSDMGAVVSQGGGVMVPSLDADSLGDVLSRIATVRLERSGVAERARSSFTPEAIASPLDAFLREAVLAHPANMRRG